MASKPVWLLSNILPISCYETAQLLDENFDIGELLEYAERLVAKKCESPAKPTFP